MVARDRDDDRLGGERRHGQTALVWEVMGAVATTTPLVFGALAIDPLVHAGRDTAVVRTLGFGGAGIFRALDALWAAPWLALPFCAAEARAALASSIAASLLAFVTFSLARKAVAIVTPQTPTLAAVLCAVAAALATLHVPALVEASSVGGATLGAVLAIAPFALVVSGATPSRVAVALGLAATYDVPVLAAAVTSCAAAWFFGGRRSLRADLRSAPWALVGLVPCAWAIWRRSAAPRVSVDGASLLSGWLGEGVGGGSAFTVLHGELGPISFVLAAAGVFVILRTRAGGAISAGLVSIVVCGVAASKAGADLGPERYSAVLLATFAAVAVLVACGMAALVYAVSQAKIPFARASAAMIVLLELALPARVADDAAIAYRKLPHESVGVWAALAWGSLPFGSVLVLPASRPLLRARASVAKGTLRDDVAILATKHASESATSRELLFDPRLAPLLRDLALYGQPEEYSLSQLAAARPVLVAFDPAWDKRFAKHLVPSGLFDRYFVEPRGPSDRARALAPISSADERSVLADPSLARATGDLMRARSLAAAAAGEHDYAMSTLGELFRVSPRDPAGIEIQARVALAHGSVDVRDLAERYTP